MLAGMFGDRLEVAPIHVVGRLCVGDVLSMIGALAGLGVRDTITQPV